MPRTDPTKEPCPVTTPLRSRGALLALAVALAVPLSACSSDDEPADSSAAETSSSAPATESSAAPAADEPFGAGCAALPADGPGSIAAMAGQSVVTAAAGSPVLTGLASVVQAANLVEPLNSQTDITVLAPVNTAFEAVPPDVQQQLLADTARLTATLTHHVIQGRLTPEQLAGTHTTLNNDQVTIEGSGEEFAVPADQTLVGQAPATVVCGNVRTANATLYLIDQVLAVPAG
jgi:uncharacterized surface protein with fasciclin (FAS1) repeats